MRGLCFFFLSILTQGTFSDVIGLIGHNVTLPCEYDTQTHGVLSFCWGQGTVPTFKCSSTILSSQDGAVQSRQSSRYQLLGRVTEGDVSLTILNAQLSDGGVYGCRVEIPGLFNDYKVNIHLVMEEAPVEQVVTQQSTVVTQQLTVATDGRHAEQSEILTTSVPKNVEVADPTVDIIHCGRTKEIFKALLRVENIARMGAIFFSTIIIILVFIFRGSFQSGGDLLHVDTSAAENIYESVPK
ncbi:hepatitis A virus cellular receptor 1 homolog [Toxotes jaculatrix]|uniref:hepatitis A virus cellular receptor 1 homolog n=1 Tax=Toxotes jaculatrix TaxID=941984 RepID=UPI001B3AC37A|nr:hepatitis A virus cellular receptor 1 homolog [Toxotes jaculatrix]